MEETEQEKTLRYLRRKPADEAIRLIFWEASKQTIDHKISLMKEDPGFFTSPIIQQIKDLEVLQTLTPDQSTGLKVLRNLLIHAKNEHLLKKEHFEIRVEKECHQIVIAIYQKYGWTSTEMVESGALDRFQKNGFQ